MPTIFPEPAGALPSSARGVTTTAPGAAAFSPGQVMAGRYLVVGLLGRGGMGEVYRADDLKLGTAVALKFLPREVERDPAALERFHAEVRTARQVSHPHVCRVYDIGEVDGRHFLSMEYVDGEDLATLLRRIGRLPPAKAVEISRQLCAGLAAAHEKGVLHRDLKPANVMIDGHGRARITDFGLAVLGEEAAAELAGTPAYMAPEQLAGGVASVQSDLYSLGLVCYEIFTGKMTFEAGSLAEWRRVHSESQPTSPSLHTADVDPVVERVILRCLEKDPARRPRSAAQVASALPGGDPLAAAIAAGETPSPEMVAAAGGEGSLSAGKAWSLLALFVALLGTIATLSPHSTDLGLAPMRKSPDALRDRAREVVERFGYVEPPVDEAAWLERDYGVLRWLADHLPSTEWRRRLREIGSPVVLRYRRADAPLLPLDGSGAVTSDDPPGDRPGSIQVTVDAAGHLREARAMAPRWSPSPSKGDSGFPEEALFRETGLDRSRFEPVTPEWIPAAPFDARREWAGSRAEAPEIPLRLSAAAFDGRIVAVSVLGPWSRTTAAPRDASLSTRISQATLAAAILLVLATSAFFARRNLRLGRGDRRGAFRLALLVFALSVAGWLTRAHLTLGWTDLVLARVLPSIGRAVAGGAILWLIYVALEPYVRRRMPDLLVGWARVLEGRFRDPRVGRDVLTGLAVGATIGTILHAVNGLPTWFSLSGQTTIPFFRSGIGAGMAPLACAIGTVDAGVQRALFGLAILFVFRLVVSRAWPAAILLGVVFSLLALGGENPTIETPSALLQGALLAYATAHLGLLASVVVWITTLALFALPVGLGFADWYGPYAVATLAALLGVAGWAFAIALGGKSPFGLVKLDA